MIRTVVLAALAVVSLAACSASEGKSPDEIAAQTAEDLVESQMDSYDEQAEKYLEAQEAEHQAELDDYADEYGSGSAASIPWQSAKDFVGKGATVCGPVAGVGSSEDDVFLNIGRDYPDPSRFTIVVYDVGSMEVPKEATACVTGTVEQYQDHAQIEVRSASDVLLN